MAKTIKFDLGSDSAPFFVLTFVALVLVAITIFSVGGCIQMKADNAVLNAKLRHYEGADL